MITKTIGNELAALRKRKRLTLSELSKKVNIHENTLSRYEYDASKMKLETLEKLLGFYNIDEEIFFKNVCEFYHENELTQELDELSEEMEE